MRREADAAARLLDGRPSMPWCAVCDKPVDAAWVAPRFMPKLRRGARVKRVDVVGVRCHGSTSYLRSPGGNIPVEVFRYDGALW